MHECSEAGGPSGWSQSYGYDARGNRWLSANSGLAQGQTLETPIASTWYSNSPVINRVNGWGYDSAGNLTQIYGMTRSVSYDGENRQVSATINSNTSTYTYDGLGQRVMKASGGTTTVLVYDAFGNLAAEYSTQSAVSPCGTNTCYVTVDHLGSTRMLTDSDGNAAKLYDYLPFGEELLANQDGRSSLYSSTPDGFGPKFTGQVWDGETSLSWFNVRHMSGAQGRFQGVDPGNAGANPADPQTWNMYAYVGNNPLTYTDPSGEGWLSWLGSIIGGFFGGPIGAFAGWSAGTAGEAVLYGPSANIGNSIPSIGTFTGCGGPLGNCGTLGADPWNERSGLGTVQDPGRFVTDFESVKLDGDALLILTALSHLNPQTNQKLWFPFAQGFLGAEKRIQSRPSCSAFYGGQGIDTMNKTTYSFLRLPGNAAAQTFQASSVAFNTNGALVSGQAKSGYLYRDWKPADLRSLIFLHELGHQTKNVTKFTSDNGIQQYNDSQSLRVTKACF